MSASSSKSSLFITLRPWLISAVALLALVLLVQQLAKPSGPERPERGPRGAVSEDFLVSASAVERVDLPVHYNALGTVTAFNTVVVRSRIDGELVKVLFEEGQRVKAGDLLAVIDPRSYRAALDEADLRLVVLQALDVLRRCQQVQVVIAENTHQRVAHAIKEAQGFQRLRATVDQVTDQPQSIKLWVERHLLEQAFQRFEAALQVADGIRRHQCKDPGTARRNGLMMASKCLPSSATIS